MQLHSHKFVGMHFHPSLGPAAKLKVPKTGIFTPLVSKIRDYVTQLRGHIEMSQSESCAYHVTNSGATATATGNQPIWLSATTHSCARFLKHPVSHLTLSTCQLLR